MRRADNVRYARLPTHAPIAEAESEAEAEAEAEADAEAEAEENESGPASPPVPRQSEVR